MNIFYVFNNTKSIQYLFDTIIKLSENNKIYYYLNHQMCLNNFDSNKLYANKNDDIRFNLINTLKKNNCIFIPKNLNNIIYLTKNKLIDIVIIDDSNGLEKGNTHGYNNIYKLIKKINKNIPVIGNIEGIKDFNIKIKGKNQKNTQLSIKKSLIYVMIIFLF